MPKPQLKGQKLMWIITATPEIKFNNVNDVTCFDIMERYIADDSGSNLYWKRIYEHEIKDG